MYLTIPARYRRYFLASSARLAQQPIMMTLCSDTLEIRNMPPAMAAAALSAGAFPAYEQDCLARLTARHFSVFDTTEQARIVTLAHMLLREDVCRDTIASGPRRLQRVAEAMTACLRNGMLDFLGFCRFSLPGHLPYLRRTLDLAADALLAEEEEEEYHALLLSCAQPDKESCPLHLFFNEKDICHIWQHGRKGIRLLEGGCFSGREDMLLANVIALRPRTLTISGAALAPAAVLQPLQQIFSDILYDDGEMPADFTPGPHQP